jgi:DEAD/DEAH box helicase domain-containing protein
MMASKSSSGTTYILDIQTRKNYEDVGGKKGISQMGVSFAALLNHDSDEIIVYTAQDINKLIDNILAARLVVGLNLKKFVYPVLAGYRSADFENINFLDLLEYLRKKIIRRPCIEELLSGTLDSDRSIDSMKIARLFKNGKIEEVKQITIQNVKDLNSIYSFGKQHGHVFINDDTGQRWKISVSW